MCYHASIDGNRKHFVNEFSPDQVKFEFKKETNQPSVEDILSWDETGNAPIGLLARRKLAGLGLKGRNRDTLKRRLAGGIEDRKDSLMMKTDWMNMDEEMQLK